MRILILGSEGFIGKHCVLNFMHAGNDVFGADLFEQPSVAYNYTKISRLSPEIDELLNQVSFDVIINAAGSGNVPYSMTHPLIDFESNSLDTIKALDAIRKFQPQAKYIHLSSAAVYGNPVKLPVEERDPAKPLSPYGWHKLISEQLCMEYTSVFKIRTAILRPFSVYGRGLKKQLFWDLSQRLAASPSAIELSGTGKESRDFVNVYDLVKAIEIVVQYGKMDGEIYNVASGEETTIHEVVSIFLNHLSPTTTFHFNQQVRAGDPLNWKADINKLSSLGFKPTLQLHEGLKDLAEWIKLPDKNN